ncbi:MAG: RNA polymerase sigma factor [Bacillota bacterium]
MLSREQNYSQLSDEQLATLARQDSQAFVEIYERYVDKVYSYVFYRIKDEMEAQDIVSATFMKALNHISGWRARGGGLGAWLLRIARNLTMDSFRRRSRVVPLADQALVSAAASPEQLALSAAEGEELRRLVEQLPTAQREVIILKFTIGLSNRQIAQVTGRSETAVSSLQYRALQNLKSGVINR